MDMDPFFARFPYKIWSKLRFFDTFSKEKYRNGGF